MILANKPVGQTPLQALNQLRVERPELKDEKLSYAGRLDPMAEGLLLVLVGEENKNRAKYIGLDKEYEVEVLFGVETDSYDILGLVKNEAHKEPTLLAPGHEGKVADKVGSLLASALNRLIGELKLPYPPYSSRPVNGVPLFELAKQGKLPKELPRQDSFIYSIDLIALTERDKAEVEKYIFTSINKVTGDFRQTEIKKSWEKFFASSPEMFQVAKLRIKCKSGAYMRSVAHELGKMLNTKAIALTIKRTEIGEYKIPTMR